MYQFYYVPANPLTGIIACQGPKGTKKLPVGSRRQQRKQTHVLLGTKVAGKSTPGCQTLGYKHMRST